MENLSCIISAKNGMKFVSELEKQVVANIINSEYMDVADEDMIDWEVCTLTVVGKNKELTDALCSLVQMGLVHHEGEPADFSTCSLTRHGFVWAKNNGLL